MSLSLCCLATALGGCPKDDKPTTLKLVKLVGAQTCESKDLVGADLEYSTYTVRLTFLERAATEPVGPVSMRRHTLTCFRVFPPADTVDFVVPALAGSRHTLRVDAFGADGKLAYSGLAHDLDLGASEITVFLHPTGPRNKICGYSYARAARAFHSGTVLPNGEVLFIGGLAGNKDASAPVLSETGLAFGNATVVRFDPSTLDWKQVGEALPALARAFHQAVLLPSPPEGPYDILVIGGLTTAEGAEGTAIGRVRIQNSFACTPGPCSHFFNFIPHENGRPAETGILTYTPPTGGKGGSLTYKAWAGANIDGGYYPQLTLLDDTHALLVSGARAYRLEPNQAMGDPGTAAWIELRPMSEGGPTATTSTVSRLRAGHAVARTSQGFLIVGGKLDGTYPELAADFAESTATAGGGFAPLAAPVLPSNDNIESTGWHTLTPLGLTDQQLFAGAAANELLYAGGFTGIADAVGNRPYRPVSLAADRPNPYYRLELSGAASSVHMRGDGGATGSYPDVGYHRALRLRDGSVLLSGGNSNKCRQPCSSNAECLGSKCNNKRCETAVDSPFCASDAVIVLGSNSDVPTYDRSTIAQLDQPRYGHVAVRLLDDSVLLVGGLQRRVSLGANEAVLIASGERYLLDTGKVQDDQFWLIDRGGTLLVAGQLSDNQKAGACLTRDEVGKVLSSLRPYKKTVTAPLPRTSSGRRSRTFRFVRAPAAP